MPAYVYLSAFGLVASVFIVRWALPTGGERTSAAARRTASTANAVDGSRQASTQRLCKCDGSRSVAAGWSCVSHVRTAGSLLDISASGQ